MKCFPAVRPGWLGLLALNPWAVIAFFGLALLFLVFPELDLSVHRHFFRDGAFFLRDHWLVQLSYQSVPIVTRAIVVFLVIAIGLGAAFYVKKRAAPWLRPSLYLFAALVIGPGLIVNGLFKEHWDRARPSQIVEFGGERTYSPPFHISDQCVSNCSFMSGHASVGFYLIAVALLLKGRARVAVTIVAIMFGMTAGLGRMAQGGHFLSDVIFCGFTVYAVSRWLWNICMAPGERQLSDVPSPPSPV